MNLFGLDPVYNLNDVVMGVAGTLLGLRVHVPSQGRWVKYAAGDATLFSSYGMRFPMDSPETIERANDKLWARARLEEAGLPTLSFSIIDARDPRGPEQEGSWTLKVPRGKQGTGVLCRIPTARISYGAGLLQAMSRFLIVEPTLFGPTYRFLVLDGEVLDAHVTKPPCLVGDGARTIAALLDEFAAKAADYGISVKRDVETVHALQTQGLSEGSVLPSGRSCAPTFVSNISRGGSWSRLGARADARKHGQVATRAASAVGLRLCGVDLMESLAGDVHVLEANPSPGVARFTWDWQPTFTVGDIDLRVPTAIINAQLRSLGCECAENATTILSVERFASMAAAVCGSTRTCGAVTPKNHGRSDG